MAYKSDGGIAKSVVNKGQKYCYMHVLHNNFAVNTNRIKDVDVLLKEHTTDWTGVCIINLYSLKVLLPIITNM